MKNDPIVIDPEDLSRKLETLTDEQAGALIKALCHYAAADGERKEMDRKTRDIFHDIRIKSRRARRNDNEARLPADHTNTE